MDISHLDKAEVLAALYNGSKQQGMGFIHPRGQSPLSADEAQALLDRQGSTYFDYLHGRILKINLSGDELDTRLYNRDNGPGAAEAAIAGIPGVEG